MAALDLVRETAQGRGPEPQPAWLEELIEAHRAWTRGIVPGRGGGRAAQNPRLLRAFAVLDRAQERPTGG